MADYPFVDADSHVLEPRDLWTKRIDKQFRDKAPHVVKDPPGMQGECWVAEGREPFSAVGGGFLGATRDGAEYDHWVATASVEDCRAGAYEPVERLKDMAQDGVAATLFYPTNTVQFFTLTDAPFQTAIFRAYNDWAAEVCSYDRNRIGAVGLISLLDLDGAPDEIRRCAAMGLKGAFVPLVRPDLNKGYDDSALEPIWAACVETGLPVNFHTYAGWWPYNSEPNFRVVMVNIDYPVRKALTEMVFSGVLDRFPELKIGVAEFEAGWLPHFLWIADHKQRIRPRASMLLERRPSEYFKDNMWITVIEDPLIPTLVSSFGSDHVMWSSDYPHVESTWPRSHEYMDRALKDVSVETRRKITRDNALDLFGFKID